jgi:hypothetical protein
LGVDVFFVLSGFLITSLLLTQLERGHIKVFDFWARRMRRLLPALLVLLGVVVVWGAFIAPSVVRDGLRGDITATLFYVANWHFISTSTYFASDGVARARCSTCGHWQSRSSSISMWPLPAPGHRTDRATAEATPDRGRRAGRRRRRRVRGPTRPPLGICRTGPRPPRHRQPDLRAPGGALLAVLMTSGPGASSSSARTGACSPSAGLG